MVRLTHVLTITCLVALHAVSARAADEENGGWFEGMGNSIGGLFRRSEVVRATIAEPYIEMRTQPGRGYPIFYIAERGEIIEILKERTDWYKVRTRKGKEGWVFATDIAKTLGPDGNLLPIGLPTFEDYLARRWEGGMMYGDFDGADAVSVYGSWQFTRNLALEADATTFFGTFSDGKYLTLNLVHQPFPDRRLSPFVALGGGFVRTEPKFTLVRTEDSNDKMLDVGIGVRYYLTRRFLVRAQYKHYVVLTSRDSHEKIDEWKISFSAFF
jgi:Bacterial SH3 domain